MIAVQGGYVVEMHVADSPMAGTIRMNLLAAGYSTVWVGFCTEGKRQDFACWFTREEAEMFCRGEA